MIRAVRLQIKNENKKTFTKIFSKLSFCSELQNATFIMPYDFSSEFEHRVLSEQEIIDFIWSHNLIHFDNDERISQD